MKALHQPVSNLLDPTHVVELVCEVFHTQWDCMKSVVCNFQTYSIVCSAPSVSVIFKRLAPYCRPGFEVGLIGSDIKVHQETHGSVRFQPVLTLRNRTVPVPISMEKNRRRFQSNSGSIRFRFHPVPHDLAPFKSGSIRFQFHPVQSQVCFFSRLLYRICVTILL